MLSYLKEYPKFIGSMVTCLRRTKVICKFKNQLHNHTQPELGPNIEFEQGHNYNTLTVVEHSVKGSSKIEEKYNIYETK